MSKPFQAGRAKSVGLLARDAVLQLIQRQALKAGDRLPSEAELSQDFDISRPMLREALRLLEQEGLVRAEHGRGRFLSAAATLNVARPITAYESISVMLGELGYQPDTEVLSLREGTAGEDGVAAAALGCDEGLAVVFLERLRSQGGEDLVYSLEVIRRDCLPAELIAEELEGSLNELLASQQKQPRMSSASVTATPLPERIGGKLSSPQHACWLLVTETCLTDDGLPVIYARDYHRGDIFSFNFTRR